MCQQTKQLFNICERRYSPRELFDLKRKMTKGIEASYSETNDSPPATSNGHLLKPPTRNGNEMTV